MGNELISLNDTLSDKGILSEPGDTLVAKKTKNGDKILKLHKGNGNKMSLIEYHTGTYVGYFSDKKRK